MKAVEKWKYEPKRNKDGVAAIRRGVQTQITFELSGYGNYNPEQQVRPLVRRNFLRVRRKIEDGDFQGGLEKLVEIEERFGDTFTQAESGTFHQFRAAARLGLKDYAGALDDFRMAKTVYLPPEAREAIGNAITQLEEVVAAQEAQAAAQNGGDSLGPDQTAN